MGDGFDKSATSLQVVSGVLYAGGQFLASGARPLKYLAQWDGSAWQQVGGGPNNSVYAMTNFRGRLYVGGQFTQVGTLPADAFASWDGQSWYATPDNFNNWIMTLTATDDRLIAGGFFTTLNDLRVNRVASWNGTDWDCLGSGFLSATSAFSYGELLLVSGERPHQGATTGNLYSWDGRDWSRLGPAGGTPTGILAYAMLGNDLVVGGQFARAGMQNVAKWNGTTWSAMGNIDNGSVKALAVYNGQLYAAGDFALGNRYSFARWTGTFWQNLGLTSMTGIRALCVRDGLLYLGGLFGSSAGIPTSNIAAWNGTSLVGVGGGLPSGSVNSLAILDGDLIVGGQFRVAGETAVERVARWNGTSWTAFSTGLSSEVKTIAVHGAILYAGLEDGRLSSWNGTEWLTRATASSPPITGLVSHKGELGVVGAFSKIGGRPAARFARYSESGVPPVHTQPQSQLASCGSSVVFQALPFSGYSGLGYSWKKDGQALLESPELIGVATNTLTLLGASSTSAGDYQCVISTNCSDQDTDIATLQLFGDCCPTDLNGDSATDDADFVLFVAAYNILDCTDQDMPADCPSDFNGDNAVNDTDFVTFVAAYNELLCS